MGFLLKIDNVEINVYPTSFIPSVLDLDNSESTQRSASGVLTRDRVAVKRKIELGFEVLTWTQISTLLQSMSNEFFELYYPDIMTGTYETKTFYVNDRTSPVLVTKGDDITWGGLNINLVEK